MDRYRNIRVKKYSGQLHKIVEDQVAAESPVTIFVNDIELATLVCTPEYLEELAAGFLFSDGLINSPKEIKSIKIHPEDGLIWVDTHQPIPAAENFLKRYITTCCGKGRPSFYFINDAQTISPIDNETLSLTPGQVQKLISAMEERSVLFQITGGAHGAALCNPENLLAFYEDIGRHNAVDKITGYCLLNGINLKDKALAITGRISSEILIKTARIGISIIISRSAPTDLAVALAEELGVTLVGFARGERLNVYTHHERII